MTILTGKINAGASEPFRIIHVSDTHLTYADSRDDQRKIELSENRSKSFPDNEKMAGEIIRLKKETGYPVIYTGDLIDFVSVLNIEKAREFTKATDCFMSAGNHEFSLYVGEAKEDEAYRNKSLDKVQTAFCNDIRFSSRIINGVNFVAVDNSYYTVDEWQFERLKKEVSKGLPVILCVHNPLYEESFYDYQLKKAPDEPAYLMSVPEDKMKYYSPSRYEQQKENEVTHRFFEYVMNEPDIKGIITGHIHSSVASLPGEKTQLSVGCTDCRIIEIL